ncbi:chloroplast ribosomal protein L4 [Chloropicon roscoffensis]|uniref:Large ribosomal subunit protein uL4c n=1 Tax=Chloropicon roscoffensis TaxID=1461544 RepID=A0AAX4NZY5_9CHLO|mmetsp:Transcript_10362/g.31678  ORF Transcript_10362/g.31678 Transcript_10362/m.31678 type:complete len:245 (-) Transcript_10362:66-800(-)|eukprot:CAMPEP_0198467530 /NCGR_PEP_ID=MMETSP1456-20131121/4831_1 /TAXON_ID=1461544 ORGANISM="Unidentified sp., Strain RCC1871" /NCGR_SAMPLE_ID=MMETSP1456 /ASSEMBLY_ACC=CAM_ASM_001119 /LENGTH=244 /DNA_ID=CAMNT_0044193565 /DNA_START=100 /DNA_END=834 /DNA_ORIENTATION=-
MAARTSFVGKPLACAGRVGPRATQVACRSVTRAQVAEVAVLNETGEKTGTKQLDLKFAGESSKGLVHRYVVHVLRNQRQGTSSTLTRGEVRGGGRKPYQQKGTGNARRGSRRSPLIPGGGAIFGPKPKDWSSKMNKKERRLALSSALVNAADAIQVVPDLDGKFGDMKTKSVVSALQSFGCGEDEKVLLITKDQENEGLYLGGRNIPKLTFNVMNNIHIYDLLNADRILMEESVVPYVQETFGA